MVEKYNNCSQDKEKFSFNCNICTQTYFLPLKQQWVKRQIKFLQVGNSQILYGCYFLCGNTI